MDDIVIIGFGGHAKSVADSIIKSGQYNIVGYTDMNDCHSHYNYLGADVMLNTLYQNGVHHAVLGIGFMGEPGSRDFMVKFAKEIGFLFPAIIDPSATIASDVVIGEGTFVGKNAVINSMSKIGDFCIINTGSIIEHENVVGDYTHASVGTILCGNVRVGHHTMIGAGTTVIQCKKIGNNCIIGANSTVLSDVENNMTVYGIVRHGEV